MRAGLLQQALRVPEHPALDGDLCELHLRAQRVRVLGPEALLARGADLARPGLLFRVFRTVVDFVIAPIQCTVVPGARGCVPRAH